MAMCDGDKELVDLTQTWARWSWRRRVHGSPYHTLCKMLRDAITEKVGPCAHISNRTRYLCPDDHGHAAADAHYSPQQDMQPRRLSVVYRLAEYYV